MSINVFSGEDHPPPPSGPGKDSGIYMGRGGFPASPMSLQGTDIQKYPVPVKALWEDIAPGLSQGRLPVLAAEPGRFSRLKV